MNLAQKYAREPVWAIVGASNDRGKYGNRIYRKLRQAGYTVYPVNLRETVIEGDPAYKHLADLPQTPTVVDLVIPPQNTLDVVKAAKAVGASAVWFQPGSEDAMAIAWARENGLDVVQDCILVRHIRTLGARIKAESEEGSHV